MRARSIAIVGAAETDLIGKLPMMSQIELHAQAARRALADAGLKIEDIDGLATAGETPTNVAFYLGMTPTWVDGTNIGGCSFIAHVRHAAAAIAAGHCHTVLITHGESGRSGVGTDPWTVAPHSLMGQFELPYTPAFPPALAGQVLLRYMHHYGISEEQVAMVAVVQREWAAHNPRAAKRDLLTVDDVLASRMIAYPLRQHMCCLVSDAGGALVLTSVERARDSSSTPVFVVGAGEATESPMVSQLESYLSSKAFRLSGKAAFESARLTPKDIDHLMIYDAFAHIPLFGLEDLGFVEPGAAAQFIWQRNTAPGGALPLNTNGGGLSYTHSGMYGMFALQEAVRQLRGTAAAQVEGVRTSLVHGFGGMFNASSTVILANEAL